MPRPPRKPPTTAEMTEVAQLFYGANLRKGQIADRLHIAKQAVTRILEEAKRVGLVKIEVAELLETDLQKKIGTKYPHLVEVLIVPAQTVSEAEVKKPLLRQPPDTPKPRPDAELIKRLGTVAAQYFDRLVDNAGKGPMRIGVTGGESLLEFANAVPDRLRERVYFYPTALVGRGRVPRSVYHVDAVAIATILWARSGRLPDHCHYVTVPPYDTKARELKARKFIDAKLKSLAATPSVRAVIKEMDSFDAVFAGIGTVNPSGRLTMTGLLDPLITPQQLREDGAVADFCYHLIDETGKGRDNWEFFIAAGHYSKYRGLAFLQHMVEAHKRVVAIAGPRKCEAIIAALKAKVFNVWITDSDTVQEVLKRS
jgi:DNA-binding transcriptional regulator LsrR (DeoR family)